MVSGVSLFRNGLKWYPPPGGWLKCNTDGPLRGNSRLTAAFYIRNHERVNVC